ncbi:vWA domain-containing protein [Methylophaga sp.]|uniref:vWA domain-containing protein n=1 Tax=Methylophaga sp. TaxID=2024840 RepID=UPI0025D25B9F|nr:vWA domain-containing protein [Methylophaga sp.]
MSLVYKLALPFFLLFTLPVTQAAAASEPISDVRVVIDVSGSMKQNDPNNLRAPAMRMLVGLMPEDETRAGVWTFAQMVNMLVPWREVNDEWRQNAIEKSTQIHSHGLFTNIEQALQKATANQKQADPDYRRSMILLSDGFVDLKPGKAATQASRQRILDKLVARLKALQITVHTIALSDNADHELLKALSMATDGWYRQADSAEELQRIFLHLFEQSTNRDTVPLADNQFSIDKSVEEMTVLAFRQPGSAATKLQLPDGTTLEQSQQSERIRWLHEDSFDLITVEQPVPGQWQINAELDPDNRVMVVTDMQLRTSDLPNNVLVGEQFDFEARLTEKGEVISRPAFLHLVDGQLVRKKATELNELPLNRRPDEAVYRASLGTGFEAGRNDVIVTMKSATFERQRRQSINVIAAPISIDTTQLEQPSRSHRIEVEADAGLINPDSLSITALLREQDGDEWPYEMLKIADNRWRLTLTDLEPEQDYTLSLQLRGATPEGRQVFLQPEAITLTDNRAVQPEPAEAATPVQEPEANTTETEQNIAEQQETEITQTVAPAPEPEVAPAEPMSDTMKLLIGNAVILFLLLVGIIWWRRQTASAVPAGDLI